MSAAPDWVNQASNYAAMGFSVIPVAGKLAAVKWQRWQHNIMPAAEIRRCFSSPVVTGIAVLLGGVSGDLACRDFDDKPGQPCTYPAWKAAFPDLAAELPTVKTPNGFHVYFRGAGIRTHHLGDGELRGAGGYCLLPSSTFQGKQYTFLKPFEGEILKIDPSKAGLSNPLGKMNREDRSGLSGLSELSERNAVVYDPQSKNSVRSLEQAVSLSVPSGPGQNHRQLFLLARGLLSLQHHFGRNISEQERMDAFSLWHKQATPHLKPGRSYDEYMIEFLEAWDRARYPLGEGQLIADAWQAASTSAPPAGAVSRLSDPRFLLLASFCRELQRRAGAGPFYLACRTVQDRFELASHVTGYNWLLGLVRLKILEIVERGVPGVKGGKATRFRYLLPLNE